MRAAENGFTHLAKCLPQPGIHFKNDLLFEINGELCLAAFEIVAVEQKADINNRSHFKVC